MRHISLQGHRGARGLLAENTLPSLAKAFEYAMHGIEFDVQLSKDNQLVIYHDLKLKPAITRSHDGIWLKQPAPAIRSLTVKQLKKYKLGRINKNTPYGLKFRKQRSIEDQTIPTLSELVEYFDKKNLHHILLNIEIKHSPLKPELCPRADVMAQRVTDEVTNLKIADRCILQCFNWSVLESVKQINPTIPISCLTMITPTENTVSPFKNKVSPWNAGLDIRDYQQSAANMVADFGANFWSPYFKNLCKTELDQAHANNLKVVTWTVNHSSTMKRFMNWGVDGIITDYPNKLQRSWSQWKIKVHK